MYGSSGGGHYSRGREQGGGGGGGGGYRPDRSRSRDARDPAREGGFPGGRGGGGGGRRGGGQPRPERSMLKTNFYAFRGSGIWYQYLVEIIDGKKVWVEEQAVAAAVAAAAAAAPAVAAADQANQGGRRTFARDVKGRPIIVPRRRGGAGGEVRQLDLDRMERTENPLPVRIMKQLMLDEIERLGGDLTEEGRNFVIAYDQANAIYVPRRMFDPATTTSTNPAAIASSSNAGEDQQDHQDQDAPFSRTQPGVYHVRVKKDCEPDDPDADRMPYVWYIVRLREVASRDLSSLDGGGLITAREENAAIAQVVNTMLRTAFAFAGFPTVSSYSFIKDPAGRLRNLLRSRELKDMLPPQGRNVSDVFPSVGVLQMLKYCVTDDGNNRVQPLVQRDVKIGYFDMPEARILQEDGRSNRGSIAGVAVGDLQRVITDDQLRSKVEAALKRKKFSVAYTTNNREQERRWREQGLAEEEIANRRKVVRGKNLTMKPDREQGNAFIIWDPSSYTFPIGPDDDAPRTTVQAYFLERYGIRLNYHRMPLVHTFIRGRSNWLPVEFLLQSFGKAKDANGPNHVRAILAEKDSAAGPELMNSLRTIYAGMFPDVAAYLASCNIQISNEPLRLCGKILPLPQVRFANQDANVDNGSWDLRNAKFSRPSDMNSFGILDLSSRGTIKEYLTKQFPVMESHGMTLPDSASECVDMAGQFVVRSNGTDPRSLEAAFNESVSKARDFFIHDMDHRFRQNDTWFKSRAVNRDNGQVSECLVIPHPAPERDPKTGNILTTSEVGLILPRDVEATTHQVRVGDNEGPARIMVRAIVRGSEVVRDPFDTRYWNSSYQVKQNGQWVHAEFRTYVYQLLDNNGANFGEPLTPDRLSSYPIPHVKVPAKTVEGPALIFVYLPERDKDLYHLVKMMGTFEKGITTQVITQDTFDGQRNKHQFCSSVALKLNGKLSNQWNEGRAWMADADDTSSRLAWFSDRRNPNAWIPTLVMGLSMSRGLGQGSVTIVAATACLDQWGMQTCSTLKIQDENSAALKENASMIARPVLMEITKEIATQFSRNNNGRYPERVLVYRDGLSDGNFPAARTEIESIRQAFYDLASRKEDFECKNSEKCQRKGCIFCTPTITLISCQNDHGIKLVPSDDREGVRGRGRNAPVNVHSGTVVDHTITEGVQNLVLDDSQERRGGPEPPLFHRVETSNYDFLLTPQQGLKGTSRPVYYRILLNENDIYNFAGGTRLDRTALEELTYQMSFLYSTATKSTRSIPVVHYSKSLANQAMGWIGYLLATGRIICEQNEDSESEYFRVDDTGHRSKQLLPAFIPYDPDHPQRTRSPFRPCGLICAMAKKG